MASLVLGIAGTAVGPSLFGGGLFGFTGAQIGGALGTLIGTEIDAALMPAVHRKGPRLSDISLQSSREGTPIPRAYGRLRLSGQLIWASRFRETATTHGGKGSAPRVVETDYSYTVSFAVGLCAGPVSRIGRVWADGNLLDLSRFVMRVHVGDETQTPDATIAEVDGGVPAYRGLAYVVFEDFPVTPFGNRIPQLAFEVIRAVSAADPAALENRLGAVALIPGAGEFVYAPAIVSRDDGEGATAPENAHDASGLSDLDASLDDLASLAPGLGAVSLVVGWFGDDLRAGICRLKPGVETAAKLTYPETWSVAGFSRAQAHLVSTIDGRPAYGGTPSDASVAAALADLKARGLEVMFCPFIFMDIAPGNALPNPYTDHDVGQPAHPWRGRLTVSPARGVAGSADGTAAATGQIAAFFADYRAMVLHYATLCAEAGGVEAFLIGSELVTLTRARSDVGAPAIDALRALAAEVRAILPSARIGYAADWSEYGAAVDGPNVRFPLDPLWAVLDFVGIDNYLPLADWRDGRDHLDAVEFPAIHDRAYLAANIKGGEYYDWYYADAAARDAQRRTPISDALGKPWVFRAKDLWGWWSNTHHERTTGVESATPTSWLPRSKPIRFCELGCPAVDKGANEPNLFPDAKSSESGLPHYSSGARDDLIQRRFLEAHLAFWSDPANNPVAAGVPLVDATHIYVWAWDARPYPAFPACAEVWGDAANWRTGHWLNGRLGAVQLSDLVGALCRETGFAAFDAAALNGTVTGYVVADTLSARDALAPLMSACFFDGVESGGLIRFLPRGRDPVAGLGDSDLVLPDEGSAFALERAQETDLPNASRLTYIDAAADYRQASVEARRLVTRSDRVASSSLPMVLEQAEAAAIGERLLQDAWVMREQARFALPPSQLMLDPGDDIVLEAGGRSRRLRLTGIDDAGARAVQAVATDPSVYDPFDGPERLPASGVVRQPGRALVEFLDLPLLTAGQDPAAPFAAAFADPWPGTVQVLRDGVPNTAVARPASLGTTTRDFWSGPVGRWDEVNTLGVRLVRGTLASAGDAAVFAGANALALRNADGDWEIVQFAEAQLAGPNEWLLTRLLRGQRGTEAAMRDPMPAGARVVVLDAALAQLSLSEAEALIPHTWQWGPAGKPLSDAAFQEATLSFQAAGLIPFAPCHVRFAWQADGGLLITWHRRDRMPASFLRAETPMSEAAELYDLEILRDGQVVRTFCAIPQHCQLYSAAQQAADFPAGLPSPLVVNVYQRSSVVGRGRRKTESLHVR